jgi:hypothetical protein
MTAASRNLVVATQRFDDLLGARRGMRETESERRSSTLSDTLRARALKERGCPRCAGAGWFTRLKHGFVPWDAAAHVRVCGCSCGRRFWAMALANPDGVCERLGISADGRATAPDGAFGGWGVNQPAFLDELARGRALLAKPAAGSASASRADDVCGGNRGRDRDREGIGR